MLAQTGTMWIEVPYVGEFLDHNEFDTIYHEHLSYVSVAPVARLCEQLDLAVVDVEEVGLHGGSILIGIQHAGASEPTERLKAFLAREIEQRYCDPQRHYEFAEQVLEWKQQFRAFMFQLSAEGAYIVGYGAAAKANTLLCWCPEAAAAIDVILDKSPMKTGKYTPGTHIKVQHPDGWEKGEATHMLILAWNFAPEIRRQMAWFEEAGGRFAVPIPLPQVFDPKVIA